MKCPKCGRELHNKYNLCLDCDFSVPDDSYEVDTSNITELYKAARRAKTNGAVDKAVELYSIILQHKPDDWEAKYCSKRENYDESDGIASQSKTLEDGTVVYKMAVEKEEKEARWKESSEIETLKKKKMNKIVISVLVCSLIILIIYGIVCLFSGGSDNEYDDVMAGYDWGDYHYYDRGSHRVETTPWK